MSRPEAVVPRRPIAERNLEAILDGAERLLQSGRALNFSAVAAEAGVSRPTVYAHFPDQERLVAALVERAVGAAAEAFASARLDEGPPADALRRLIQLGWEQHLAHHLEVAKAASSYLSADALHAHHHAAEEMIEALIRRGQREGSFRDDLPAHWLAAVCLAAFHSTAAVVGSGRMDPQSAVNALVTTVADLCVRPRRRRS